MMVVPETLLCWHAKRAGSEVLTGALQCFEDKGILIGEVIYLVQRNDKPDFPPSAKGRIRMIELPIDDPTRHEDLYEAIKKRVLPLFRESPGRLNINISPGTPAMHSIWLLLHAGGAFPEGTRLWSSQVTSEHKKPRLDEVRFRVSSYLAEISKGQNTRPGSAAYDPEAKSPARRKALEKLARYAKIPGAPLLILGERGTGKTRLVETFVKKLKSRETLVPVACGNLGTDLADSTLFGHTKNAFTGANKDRNGLLKEADNGILFLDEIQDLPKVTQRKLLHTFQDQKRRYRQLGSDSESSSHFELVCASNLSMDELRNRLDADFFDRVSMLVIHLPPLRECREDLQDDWERVWTETRHSSIYPESAPWSDELQEALAHDELPGNLRELQRLAMYYMAWHETLPQKKALSRAIAEWRDRPTSSSPETQTSIDWSKGGWDKQVRDFKRELATQAKERFGTWKLASVRLDVHEKTLRNALKPEQAS